MKSYLRITFAGLGALSFLWLATILPRTTTELFASPDETAVMAFARAWTPGNGFRVPNRLPADLSAFVSLHPRSQVRQGEWLVPVGFLGMPFVVMLVEKAADGFGAYLTALLVLSAAYPLWRLASRTSPRVATTTVILTLFFPTVLLYANRGLFPNLPVVALAIWSVWAWGRLGTSGRQDVRTTGVAVFLLKILAGLTLGVSLAIRPTEALWLLPWIIWSVWVGSSSRRPDDLTSRSFLRPLRPYVIASLIAVMISIGGLWLAYQTYPSAGWLPIGYQLRDSLLQTADRGLRTADRAALSLPFGFHPRVMWENARLYLFSYLSPWIAAAFFGAYLSLRRRWDKESSIFLVLTGWTAGVLLLIYGQAIYTDNIRGTISLGNSFLRYMLPLVPLVAYGIAHLIDALWRVPRRGRLLAATLTAFFVFYGAAVAWGKDEEGLRNTRRELVRYETIRREAEERLAPGTIVLSERSDKIFATGPFVAVSPLPDKQTFRALVSSKAPIALFHRRLTPEEVASWMDITGQLPQTVFEIDNEAMYAIKMPND